MRIAQVCHWFPPEHHSGTEQHVLALASELGRRHEVTVFCGRDLHTGPQQSDEDWPAFHVRRVRVGPEPADRLWHRMLGRFRNRRAEQAWMRFLADFRPDVVHVHHLFKLSAGLIALAKRQGIPVLVTLHDYWFICDNAQLLYRGRLPCAGPAGGWRCAGCMGAMEMPGSFVAHAAPLATPLYLYRYHLLRRALRRADAVIAPSAYVYTRLQAAGATLKQVRLLPHGTDDGWLAGYRRQPGEGHLRIGYLGTVAPHKGVDILLQALARLPVGRAELHIYGPGQAAYLGSLRSRAEGLPVQFHGPYERKDLGRVLGGLDLVVVPSLWPENAPLVVQEALLARVPVVAARIGGMGEWVQHGKTGLLVAPGDPGALAAALQQALDDPALLARWSAAIRPPKTMAEYAGEVEELYVMRDA